LGHHLNQRQDKLPLVFYLGELFKGRLFKDALY
jgi:hypothetical protein